MEQAVYAAHTVTGWGRGYLAGDGPQILNQSALASCYARSSRTQESTGSTTRTPTMSAKAAISIAMMTRSALIDIACRPDADYPNPPDIVPAPPAAASKTGRPAAQPRSQAFGRNGRGRRARSETAAATPMQETPSTRPGHPARIAALADNGPASRAHRWPAGVSALGRSAGCRHQRRSACRSAPEPRWRRSEAA